jgi:hypothetical protein
MHKKKRRAELTKTEMEFQNMPQLMHEHAKPGSDCLAVREVVAPSVTKAITLKLVRTTLCFFCFSLQEGWI